MRINKLTVKLVKEQGVNYNHNPKVTSPSEVVKVLNTLYDLENEPTENMVMLLLDTKYKIIGSTLISKGTVNASLVSPREVFQQALLGNAVSILIAHNHPSGNPTPSNEDVEVTKRLVKGGKLIGVNLLDHIIIGDNKYLSLKEEGYL